MSTSSSGRSGSLYGSYARLGSEQNLNSSIRNSIPRQTGGAASGKPSSPHELKSLASSLTRHSSETKKNNASNLPYHSKDTSSTAQKSNQSTISYRSALSSKPDNSNKYYSDITSLHTIDHNYPRTDVAASASRATLKSTIQSCSHTSEKGNLDRNYKFSQSGGHCYGYSYAWMSSRLRVPNSLATGRLDFLRHPKTRSHVVSTQDQVRTFYSASDKSPEISSETTRRDCISKTNTSWGISSNQSKVFEKMSKDQFIQATINSIETPGVYFIQQRYNSKNGNNLGHAIAVDTRSRDNWMLFDCNHAEFTFSKPSAKIALSHILKDKSMLKISLTKMDVN
jgi:hypothetical protein